MLFSDYIKIRGIDDDMVVYSMLTGTPLEDVQKLTKRKFKKLIQPTIDELTAATHATPIPYKKDISVKHWYTVQTSGDVLVDVAELLFTNPYTEDISIVIPTVMGFMMRCSTLSNRTLTSSVLRYRILLVLQRKWHQFTSFFSTWFTHSTRPSRRS